MAATESSTVDANGSVPRWAVLLLAVAAALELLAGLRDLPILFGDMTEIPGPGLGGFVIKTKIALQPVFALAALIFVARGRIRPALFAMAGVVLVNWMNYLPSVAIHGLEFQGDGVGGLVTFLEIIVAPVLALAVIALAWRGQRLTLATLLAVFHTALSVLFVILFAIGVAIYGF
jgi:hypothetical protein